MFLTVSWDMHTSQATPDDVPEAMHEHEASRGPLKGAMSVLLGSETETRELLDGTEENSDSRQGIIDLPNRIIYFVLSFWPPNIRLLAPSLSSFVSILQYAWYGLPAAPPMYVLSACTDLW